jgi:hypothetical protein
MNWLWIPLALAGIAIGYALSLFVFSQRATYALKLIATLAALMLLVFLAHLVDGAS